MKTYSYLHTFLIITCLIAWAACSDSGSSSGSTSSDQISLSESLFEPGNTIALQTASGEKVDTTATDTDGNGSANGLDFNGDQVVEIEYALSVKSQARDEDAVAFTFAGSDTVYYFLLIDGQIVMWTTPDLNDEAAEEVTLVVDEETETITAIALVDDEGNETTIELETPFYFGETPTVIETDPEDGSKIGAETPIVVTLSEAASSVSLSGDLSSDAEYTLSEDGTELTITPLETWPDGADQNLVLDLANESGTAFEAVSLVYTVDGIGPSLLEADTNLMFSGSFISNSEDIYFNFGETITTNNLVIDTGPSFNTFTFSLSTTDTLNDTLTLVPDGGDWGGPCGEDITITVEDEVGNEATYNFTGIWAGCA